MSSRSSSEAGPSNSQSGVGPLLANKLPSIRILRPPPSKGSPQVDERCFTYCSQSIGGRINGAEPWCRTVCLRKVFQHEMKKHYTSFDPTATSYESVDVKYPLPPEGQKPLRFLPWVTVEDHPPRPNDHNPNSSSVQLAGPSNQSKRYWEEGWYLWMSKSRWGAQEKLDLMMQDLEAQTEWYQYKERMQNAWNKRMSQPPSPSSHPPVPQSHQSSSSSSPSPPPSSSSGSSSSSGRPDSQNSFPNLPPTPTTQATIPELLPHVDEHHLQPPPPDHTAESLLIHLPPPFEPPFEKSLGPARRMLSKTWETIENGQQSMFIGRIAEKAITEEPFILAQNVCKRAWDLWTQGGGNEEEK